MSYTRLTLLPSNQILSVEEGETILDAALRAGLNLPHSCKGGHCSSCRARILAGEVSYPGGQPLGITPDEARAGYTLLCQAHAASPELSVEIREIRPPTPEERIQSLPCRIEHMQALAPGVMAVFLRLPATETFTFVAGQYLDIMLPQNRRRSFSIANPPHVRRIAIIRQTRKVFRQQSRPTLNQAPHPAASRGSKRNSSPRPPPVPVAAVWERLHDEDVKSHPPQERTPGTARPVRPGERKG